MSSMGVLPITLQATSSEERHWDLCFADLKLDSLALQNSSAHSRKVTTDSERLRERRFSTMGSPATQNQQTGLSGFLSGFSESYSVEWTETDALLTTVEAISEQPQLRAGRADLQFEFSAIGVATRRFEVGDLTG